jgi:hypothetical protein
MDKLRFVTCYANPNFPTGHGYWAKTNRTLCGKRVRGKQWHDEGPVQEGDNFSCKTCQGIWLGMDEYEFD